MKVDLIKNDKLVIIPFWILIFFIFWLQVLPQVKSIWESILFSVLLVLTICPIANYLSGSLLLKAMKQKGVKLFMFQFSFFSLLIGFAFLAYINLFFWLENSGAFPSGSEYFDVTDLAPYAFFIPLSSGIIINITICGLRFFLEYIKSQKILVEYQLRTLQHQVTPHFMFNVLNHIHILMQTDVDLASDLLIKYSEILRYQLYNGDKQKVTLEQDIQFLKDFIAVEEIRWGDKLVVTSSWKIEQPQKEIPALLFITFIENAFKHVSKSDFEKGYIDIDFRQEGDTLCLKIENSKSTFSGKKINTGGLGLKNIKERLEILYFGCYNLTIEETDAVYRTKLIINI